MRLSASSTLARSVRFGNAKPSGSDSCTCRAAWRISRVQCLVSTCVGRLSGNTSGALPAYLPTRCGDRLRSLTGPDSLATPSPAAAGQADGHPWSYPPTLDRVGCADHLVWTSRPRSCGRRFVPCGRHVILSPLQPREHGSCVDHRGACALMVLIAWTASSTISRRVRARKRKRTLARKKEPWSK